jgi:hypothetical protein
MTQFHLLDPVYDESHRGRLVASGQVRFHTPILYVFCRLDRKKNRKIFDWAHHHRDYIEEWEMFGWYHQATRPRLKLQWTHDDYADIESSEDEDTTYDHSTHVGR